MTRTGRFFLFAMFVLALPLAAPARSAEVPKEHRGASVKESTPAKRAEGGARDQVFDRLDTNHDGFLSQLELDADPALRGNWIAMDRNNDGRIGRDEFSGIEQRDERAASQQARPR